MHVLRPKHLIIIQFLLFYFYTGIVSLSNSISDSTKMDLYYDLSSLVVAAETDQSEKRLVAVGRLCTIGLMIFSAILALLLQSALQIFSTKR